MEAQLQIPLIFLCLMLAYTAGILTVVGAALVGQRQPAQPLVIVVRMEKGEPASADDATLKKSTIHEQAPESRATFSTEAQSEEELREELEYRMRARNGIT